jgi:hypothetical protein
MRFARIESEDAERVDARIHARDERDVFGRNDGARAFEIRLVGDRVGSELVYF